MSNVHTKPEVFILESLGLEDEKRGAQEGEILSRMLKLSGKAETQYYYIRTERELDEIIDIFDDSRCRYLHISCHADANSMSTTFDSIEYAELGKKLAPCLDGRRVFVSACKMANAKLAKALLEETGCYSLVGPARAINFDDAAAFWTSFYHLMFKKNVKAMKHTDMGHYVNALSDLYGEPINYFRQDKGSDKGFKLIRTREKATSL